MVPAQDGARAKQTVAAQPRWRVSSQGEVDQAGWGGIQGLADRASRMASMGRRPWLRALTR